MQRLFGANADAEALSSALNNIWLEAHANRAGNPETAAALSYAIGRNFYFRGDNVSALSIFDAWMGEGYGPPEMIAFGEEVYAMMLQDAGRVDEAIPRMRDLVLRFDTGFATSLTDRVNYAVRLARMTRDEADILLGEDLLQQRLTHDLAPFDRLYAFSQLGSLRMIRDDREGALEAYGEVLRMYELHPEYASNGRDISRFNVASLQLFVRSNSSEADRLADLILTEDFALKGVSLQTGRGYLIRGLAAEAEGRTGDALAALSAAYETFSSFAGAESTHAISALSALAVAHASAGNLQAAEEELARASALIGEADAGDDRQRKIRLAHLLIRRSAGAAVEDVQDALCLSPI